MHGNALQNSPLDTIAWYAWESDEPESNWLLTYVDMLSVLLAMLVVLLGHMAVQQMQPPQPDSLIAPVARVAEPTQAPPLMALAEVDIEPISSVPEPIREPVSQVTTEGDSEMAAEPQSMASPESRLEAAIESDFQGAVKVVRRDQGISLEIADVILFESSKAALRPQAGEVLARLAVTLQDIGDAEIAVEGHTDDRPILGGRFLSNWDLAAARANAVTRFLLEQGFEPTRLRSVSYADTHPVADNRTAEGRAENRRVSLRVDFL